MQVELTEGEINALIQLIDIAVKSNGLRVAEASFLLHKKLDECLKENKDKA